MDEDVIDERDLNDAKKKIEDFEKKIADIISKMPEGSKSITKYGIHIEFNEETGEYDLCYEGFSASTRKFAIMDRNGLIKYQIKEIEEFEKQVKEFEEAGYEVKRPEGMPDIESLKQINKERQNAEKEHDKDGQEKEPDKSKEEKEAGEVKDEKEEKKEETGDKKPEITEPGENWIKVDPNMQVDTTDTVGIEMQKKVGPIAEIYIAPNPKDVTKYTLMVKRPGKKEFEEIQLSNSKGTNPTVNITEINENGTTTTTSVWMADINNNRFLSLEYNGKNYARLMIVNRTRENNYIGHEVADRSKPRLEKPSFETREKVGDTLDARISGDRIQEVHDEETRLEGQNLPEEIETKIKQFKDEESFHKALINCIVEDLRKQVSHAGERELYVMAVKVVKDLDESGKDYEEVKDDVIAAHESEQELNRRRPFSW